MSTRQNTLKNHMNPPSTIAEIPSETPSPDRTSIKDTERVSLGSSQTIHNQETPSSFKYFPYLMVHKIKSFYSERSSLSMTDEEKAEYENNIAKLTRHRMIAVLMVCFGTLMAIAFVLIGLGKAVESEKTPAKSNTTSVLSTITMPTSFSPSTATPYVTTS